MFPFSRSRLVNRQLSITLHYITLTSFQTPFTSKWPVVHQLLHVIQNTAHRPSTQQDGYNQKGKSAVQQRKLQQHCIHGKFEVPFGVHNFFFTNIVFSGLGVGIKMTQIIFSKLLLQTKSRGWRAGKGRKALRVYEKWHEIAWVLGSSLNGMCGGTSYMSRMSWAKRVQNLP